MNYFYANFIIIIKNLLTFVNNFDILDELIVFIIQLNTRNYEQKLKKKLKMISFKKFFNSIIFQVFLSKSPISFVSYLHVSFFVVIVDDTISMNNIINRITSKEREHRRINNFCFYCDSDTHKWVNCFKRLMRQVQINIEVMFILFELSAKDIIQEWPRGSLWVKT